MADPNRPEDAEPRPDRPSGAGTPPDAVDDPASAPTAPGLPPGVSTTRRGRASPTGPRPASGVASSPASDGDGLPEEVRAVLHDATRRLGERHVLLDELGRGGMGVVWRGYDLTLRRPVAVKLVHPRARHDAHARRRFDREARAAARLRHPGLVAVHEVGEHRGQPFIVMDLIEGAPLDETLEAHGPLAPRRAATIAHAVAQAVEHAHGAGIIHRDIKPQNIIIDAEGRPRLTDFGIARDVAASVGITREGGFLGTPGYAPPEQAIGDLARIGPRSDVYAIGAVLYHALVGNAPRPTEASPSVLMGSPGDPPAPPRAVNPAVHADLETIALRCLEADPIDRYPSADALAADLRRFLEGEPIHARPPGQAERARRWIRRNRLAAATLAALAVTILGASGIAAWLIADREAARARVADERARALADAEERAIAAARAEALRSWAELEAARPTTADVSKRPDLDIAPGRIAGFPRDHDERVAATRSAGSDALLALALTAAAAADRWAGAAPTDPAATAAAHRAWLGLGEVAADDEAWGVAANAFEKAAAFAPERDRRADEALAALDEARSAVAAERAAAIDAVLADARSGRLGARPGSAEDALFVLVRWPEPATVAHLAGALDALTDEIRAATAGLYREAAEPTADEAAAGLCPIAGLHATVDRLLDAEPFTSPADADAAALAEAGRRLVEREVRGRKNDARFRAPRVLDLLDAAATRRLGPGGALAARLCCDALGRIGIRAGAVGALGRYIAVEPGEARAIAAALALARLGGPRAERLLAAARSRFGDDGPLARRVGRLRARDDGDDAADLIGDGDAPAEGSSDGAPRDLDELLARARSRVHDGDAAGARRDAERALALAPESAAAWVALADARRAAGDPEAAIRDAGRALSIDPGAVRALLVRGIARRAIGNLAGAQSDLVRATELAPGDALAWLERAALEHQRGALDAAAGSAERAIAVAPEDARARRVRGVIRASRGDRPGALADLDRAIALDPGAPEAWRDRGATRLASGDAVGAIADLDRALELAPRDAGALITRARAHNARGDSPRATADATAALALSPDAVAAFTERGRARTDAGELQAAIADFTAAIERDPDEANHYSNRGGTRQMTGDLEGSLEDLDRAVALEPGYAVAWANRGVVLTSLDRLDEAARDFTRAAELDPRLVLAWNGLAGCHLRLGRLDEAIAAFDRAIELAPRYPLLYNNRGFAKRDQGDLDGAIADLDRAIALDPRLAMAWNLRGVVRQDRREHDAAITDFTRAIELEPRLMFPWRNRAISRLARGEPAAALVDIDRAVAVEERNVVTVGWRSLILLALDRTEDALAEAEAAMALADDEPTAWRARGLARAATGDRAGAVADLERFLEMAPEDPDAGAARARLDELR